MLLVSLLFPFLFLPLFPSLSLYSLLSLHLALAPALTVLDPFPLACFLVVEGLGVPIPRRYWYRCCWYCCRLLLLRCEWLEREQRKRKRKGQHPNLASWLDGN